MKVFNYILSSVFILFIIASCLGDGTLVELISAADQAAIEGMEEAAEVAETYNDSLVWCIDIDTAACSGTYIYHLDSLFHHHIEEFEEHHHDYSHNNVDDDHHHSATPIHTHSNDGHDEATDEEHHGHTIESHHEMKELMEHHEEYHP